MLSDASLPPGEARRRVLNVCCTYKYKLQEEPAAELMAFLRLKHIVGADCFLLEVAPQL